MCAICRAFAFKIKLLLSGMLVVLSVYACNSSNNNSGSEHGVPVNSDSVVTMDNHVQLLGFTFDILTGIKYGPTMLVLPDYPDSDYTDDTVTAESATKSEVCINGGTSKFTPFFRSDMYKGWTFDFDNCQYNATVFDGHMERKLIEWGRDIELISTGLSVNDQSTTTLFNGRLRYKSGVTRGGSSTYAYELDDVSYIIDGATGSVELRDAQIGMHVTPNGISLSGSFEISSERTSGQRLKVTILENLVFDLFNCSGQFCPEYIDDDDPKFFQSGLLKISALNGDSIVLEAATGDPFRVNVAVTNGDTTENIEQPWSVWHDNIRFKYDLRER